MSDVLTYQALLPKQGNEHTVLALCAKAQDIFRFAGIDRIGRTQEGKLRGFQRPQVANHIREIRQYLAQDNAILPNSVVVAFDGEANIEVKVNGNGLAEVRIPIGEEPCGLIVDGQQRLTALESLLEKDFEVLVSILICRSKDELRKQFILINNTRPLPKTLIYELLPTVDGLPERLTSRTTAAAIVERLNYDENSSLRGQIKQHTNPSGILQDTVMQKVIMASLENGAMREFLNDYEADWFERSFLLMSNFFQAVQDVFREAWIDQKPRTSRLVHGVGIVGMAYVMEYLHSADNAFEKQGFVPGLRLLEGKTAWTSGVWRIDGEERKWNSLQFVPRDYRALSEYLIAQIRFQRLPDGL